MNVGEPDATARLHLLFARTALAAAALTFVVIVASAFMRHSQVGLACADWPACYGRIDAATTEGAPSAGVRIVRIAHRIAATGVLALVIGLLLIAWTQKPAWKKEGTLAIAALLLAAALAVLGIVTPGARLPAVTLGNLLGGYLMLGVLAATVVAATTHDAAPLRWWMPGAPLPWLALGVLVLVFMQAALGGSIGAQYALTACPTLGKCPGFPFDEFRMSAALDPFQPLTIVDGHVVPPSNAAAVYVIHRTLGLVVPILTLLLARAVQNHDRRLGWTLGVLALATPLAGVAAIVVVPSLSLTVLHNALAALLIAALAVATARSYGPRATASQPG
jgi:cytochrome c oxidase assembly protein subunit 15